MMFARGAVLRGHGIRPGTHSSAAGGSGSLDPLLQGVIDGSANDVVIELYSGIRPVNATTAFGSMMGENAARTGVSYPLAFNYRIGSTVYSSPAIVSVPLNGPTIPAEAGSGYRYALWRFVIDAAGVVTVLPAAGNDGSTNYWNQDTVRADVPAVPTDRADIGICLVRVQSVAFVPGTSTFGGGGGTYRPFVEPVALVASYTLVPPVATLGGVVDSTHLTVNAIGGTVYVPHRPTWALCRYPKNANRIDLWCGATGSGADIILDNPDAVASDVWSPTTAQAVAS